MARTQQANIRLTPDDLTILDTLKTRNGLDSRAATVRQLIRLEAMRYGIEVGPAVPRRGRPKKGVPK